MSRRLNPTGTANSKNERSQWAGKKKKQKNTTFQPEKSPLNFIPIEILYAAKECTLAVKIDARVVRSYSFVTRVWSIVGTRCRKDDISELKSQDSCVLTFLKLRVSNIWNTRLALISPRHKSPVT